MSNAFSKFESYADLVKIFGASKIEERYDALLQQYNSFILKQSLDGEVIVNQTSLQYAITDYFSDIARLKDYHKIIKTNYTKIISYEAYWLWRRKPLQVIKDNPNKSELPFCNELFVYTHILSFLLTDFTDERYALLHAAKQDNYINGFFKTLYYHLKFRNCNPQVFELFMHAFNAGKQCFQEFSLE